MESEHMGILSKFVGTHSEREVKRVLPIVDKIESLEPDFEKLSDEELRDKTREFKSRLAGGETLDDILPEAYAVVREAAKRAIGHAPLPRAADRWCDIAPGTYHRDAYR